MINDIILTFAQLSPKGASTYQLTQLEGGGGKLQFLTLGGGGKGMGLNCPFLCWLICGCPLVINTHFDMSMLY